MPTTFTRRGGPRRPRPVAAPRIGHFYLNAVERRLFCLNETARQLVRDGLPIRSSEQQKSPLLHLDGTPVAIVDLPFFVALREGRTVERSFLWTASGPTPQTLSWNAAPLLGSKGEVVGISATAVITPQEPDWEELAGLAHDLRTPLQAIRLLVSIVQTMPRPEILPDVLHRLRGATERTMSIAHELLSWCKAPLQASRRSTSEWLALEPLLDSLLTEQETTARSKGIVLEKDLRAAQGLAIQSNRMRLGRVIGNLLANAIRYTPVGQVRLTTNWRNADRSEDSAFVIAIEDTGLGLSEEEQESIFEPFLRGRAALTDSDSGGSGIGLATVDRLVGELGLSLEVFSQSGQGSRFVLIVPHDAIRKLSD